MNPALPQSILFQEAQSGQQVLSPMVLLIRLAEALVVLAATYVIARYVVGSIPRIFGRADQVGTIYRISNLLKYVIYALGSLIALAIVAPEPGVFSALLIVLGIGVIVAFSDILRNWGSELYVRGFPQLKIGDQVEIMGREGTVIHVDSRGIVVETPTRDKIYIPNTYLAHSPVINRTSPFGTVFRVKILIPAPSESEDVRRNLEEILKSVRPELVEDPVLVRRGVQNGFSLYEASVTVMNTRKIGYILETLRLEVEKRWQGSRVYV